MLLSALMRRPSHADRDALPQSHFQDDSSAANHGGSGSVALEKLPVILGARRLPAALSERSAPVRSPGALGPRREPECALSRLTAWHKERAACRLTSHRE